MPFLDGMLTALSGPSAVLTDKWVDTGIGVLRTDVAPKLGTTAAPITSAVIDKLAANKDVAQQVSHAGFTTITNYLAMGAEDDARLVFLAEQASDDERQSSLLAAMRSALSADAERDAAWAAVKKLALDILEIAGKAAVPILLSMVM